MSVSVCFDDDLLWMHSHIAPLCILSKLHVLDGTSLLQQSASNAEPWGSSHPVSRASAADGLTVLRTHCTALLKRATAVPAASDASSAATSPSVAVSSLAVASVSASAAAPTAVQAAPAAATMDSLSDLDEVDPDGDGKTASAFGVPVFIDSLADLISDHGEVAVVNWLRLLQGGECTGP